MGVKEGVIKGAFLKQLLIVRNINSQCASQVSYVDLIKRKSLDAINQYSSRTTNLPFHYKSTKSFKNTFVLIAIPEFIQPMHDKVNTL